jgi:hypothetical protein
MTTGRRRGFRPHVEVLEDRSLPSGLAIFPLPSGSAAVDAFGFPQVVVVVPPSTPAATASAPVVDTFGGPGAAQASGNNWVNFGTFPGQGQQVVTPSTSGSSGSSAQAQGFSLPGVSSEFGPVPGAASAPANPIAQATSTNAAASATAISTTPLSGPNGLNLGNFPGQPAQAPATSASTGTSSNSIKFVPFGSGPGIPIQPFTSEFFGNNATPGGTA